MLLAPTRQDPASGPPLPDHTEPDPALGLGAGARAAGQDGAPALPAASELCQHLAAADSLADGVRRLADRVRREGVMLSTMGKYRARACTHLDVDRAGVETALQVFRAAIPA